MESVINRNTFTKIGCATLLITASSVAASQAAFVTQPSIAAGSSPVSIAVGDLNRDGKIDLSVVNQGNNACTILINNGNMSFLPSISYPIGNNSSSQAIADFNGDSKLDIAISSFFDKNVSVLLNNGDGTFAARVTYATDQGVTSFASWVAAGDVNNDGWIDLVVANLDGGSVSVLLNKAEGSGTFNNQVKYTAEANAVAGAVAIGDFNGGGLDLVISNEFGSNASILFNNGNGTFQPYVAYDSGENPTRSLVVGDFNSDGKLDVTFAGNGLSLLLNNGNGVFAPAASYATGSSSEFSFVAKGDFNKDSKLDFVTANLSDNNVSILLNKGDGTLKPFISFPVGQRPTSAAVGDIDGDGKDDVVVVNQLDNTASILINDQLFYSDFE